MNEVATEPSGSYIESFNHPSLDLPSLRVHLTNRILFVGVSAMPSSAVRLLSTFLIVTDKAIREYCRAHEHMGQHVRTANVSYFVEASGEFENCVNAIKRAQRLLALLTEARGAPPLERVARRLASVHSEQVTNIRDAIEHMDSEIATDAGLAEGAANLLTLSKDGTDLELAHYRLSIAALQATLKVS